MLGPGVVSQDFSVFYMDTFGKPQITGFRHYDTWLHLGETLHAHGGVPQLGPAGGRALGEDCVQRRDVARGDHVAPRSRAPGDAEGEAGVRGPVDDPAMIRY